jgi:tripartite-type tricarboxylate transporter receptor subunit TctC
MTMRNEGKRRVLGAILCAGILAAASPKAFAEDFYAGKQLRFLADAEPGGNFDAYVRAVAKYIVKYIPGQPTSIVPNMPGAGGLRLANYIANVAPRDGTVFGGSRPIVPVGALTNPNEAQYDPNKLSWLGSVTKELYVGYMWHTSPVQTFDEAFQKQAILGGTSVGSFSIDMAILSNEFLGTKFKIVTGYKSSPENQLAIEKGEVHGVMGTAWSSLKSRGTEWMRDKKINLMLQYGFKRDPSLPDVPLFIDYAKTEEAKQAIRFMIARLDHGKPFYGPPDIPADRLEILRNAFDAMVKDQGFIKEIAAAQGEVDSPMNGRDLTKLVAEEAATPASVVHRIEEALTKFKSAQM